MSTRKNVIVRAYADEPVALFVESVSSGRVIVENEAKSSTLSLPARSVFEMNANLFALLREAFESGDRRSLETLWDSADSVVVE